MSRALRFTELLVRRMPGFRDGGPRLSGLAAEINLVHGPNGSGKSTAARALQRLIWPSLAPRDAAVRGRFRLDGASWSVEVDGTRAVWECDGEPASPPSLPPAASRDRYLLTLDELLVAGDEDLAELIRVESAGGYDVPRAAGSLGSPGGHPHKLMSALRRATERRDAAAREAEALRG